MDNMITTRASKGSALTYTEMDNNLIFLDEQKTPKTLSNTQGTYITLDTPTTTTVSASGTWYKMDGGTTAHGSNGTIDNSISNRIKYTGDATRFFVGSVSVSLQTASNSQMLSIGIAKNGAIVAYTEMQGFLKTGNEPVNIDIPIFSQLTTGDYIELFVKNNTSTADIAVQKMQMMIYSVYTN
jgi:hypothetical protein